MATTPTLARMPAGLRLGAARAKAYEFMPYFATGVQSLIPHEMKGFGEIGVTENSVLLYDTALLGTWTAAQAGGVVLHEYLHIYSKHAQRFAAACRLGWLTKADAELWNFAADAEINDDLVAAGVPMPEGIVTPATLGFPNNLTAEDYAKRLKASQTPRPKGKPGAGKCGSGAGNPIPGEPLRDLVPGRSAGEQEMQRAQDAQNIVQAAERGRGKVPTGWLCEARKLAEPPRVSWERHLAVQVRNCVTHKQGLTDYTFCERSRAQSGLVYALGPRAPLLPGMHAPQVEVALAFDTSASMNSLLDSALCEAEGVLRAVPGARVSCLACDARVHSVARIHSAREIRPLLKGGGGTDFRPVFDAIERLRPRPNVLVFCTDLDGEFPAKEPRGISTIWLRLGTKLRAPFGVIVDLEDTDNARI